MDFVVFLTFFNIPHRNAREQWECQYNAKNCEYKWNQ